MKIMGNSQSYQNSTMEISVTEVDTFDVRQWSDITGILSDGHRDSYIDFQKESGGYVCSAIKQPSTDIHIIRRIGTDSGSGEVYEIEYRGKRAVMKILPIDSMTSETTNLNEIEIASFVSQKVINGETVHFPVVFSYATECQDISINPDISISTILRNSFENMKLFSIVKQLQSSLEQKKYGNNVAVHRNKILELAETRDIVAHPSVSILISEIVWGDLNAYIKRYNPDLETMKIIISDILKGIDEMHSMGIYHGDMHTGNVLIVLDNKGDYYQSLIHDFGRSSMGYISDNESLNDRINILESIARATTRADVKEYIALV
jgi:serine/threonine protein kinase